MGVDLDLDLDLDLGFSNSNSSGSIIGVLCLFFFLCIFES